MTHVISFLLGAVLALYLTGNFTVHVTYNRTPYNSADVGYYDYNSGFDSHSDYSYRKQE